MRESLKIVRSLRGYLKSVGFISETAQIKDEEEHRNKEFIDLKEHEFLEKKSDFLEKFIEENFNKYRREIEERGIEAIAWYCPFHHNTETEWGIYYDLNNLICFTKDIFTKVDKNSLKQAFNVVRAHEIFHFQCEMAFTIKELLFSVFIPPIADRSFDSSFYWNRDRDLEEALATAVMYNEFEGDNNHKDRLRYFAKSLPKGYSDFENYIHNFDFIEGLNRHLGFQDHPFYLPLFGAIFPKDYFILSKENVPERLIVK